MKNIQILLASLIITTSSFAGGGHEFKVNSEVSKAHWLAKKVSGQHEGNITVSSGTISVDGNTITGGEFVIDMTTITTTDLTGEYADKLMGHLKSDDFFSVANHGTATFTLKESNIKDGKATITGDLTIKGITHEISFPATVKVDGHKFAAHAVVQIDRTLYDIKYGSGKFFEGLGDKMIDDEFTLTLDLAAVAAGH